MFPKIWIFFFMIMHVESQPVKSMQRDKYGNVAVNVMGSGRQDAMAFASDGGDSRDMAQQMAKMQAEMDAMMGR